MYTRNPFTIGVYGIDGSGKTTQIGKLAAALSSKGLRVEKVQFVNHTREEAHRIAWENGYNNGIELFGAETLIICGALDMLQEVNRIMRSPCEGRIVLFDRYAPACLAEAFMWNGECWPNLKAVLCSFPRLDVEFFIRLPSEVALERIRVRDGAAVGPEEPNILSRRNQTYEDTVHRNSNIIILDGTRDKEELHNGILADIWSRLERRRISSTVCGNGKGVNPGYRDGG